MARSVPYIYADLHGAVSKQDWNNFFSHFSINSSIVTGMNVPLDSVSSSYNSAKWTVSISGSFGLRMSEIMAITNGVSFEYTETATVDIGNTSFLSLSVGLSGTSLVLYASSSSGSWIIKYIRCSL